MYIHKESKKRGEAVAARMLCVCACGGGEL